MINHYSLLLEAAHERHQELLRQAEDERRYKQLKRNYPDWLQQTRRRLADAVQQLKIHTQSKPTTPIFGRRKPIV